MPQNKDFGATGSISSKLASEGPNPLAKKGKGKASVDPDADLKAEVARLVAMGKLDRMCELADVQRKVRSKLAFWCRKFSNFFQLLLIRT